MPSIVCDVTDVCSASYVRDGRECTKVSLSTMPRLFTCQHCILILVNIGLGHRIFFAEKSEHQTSAVLPKSAELYRNWRNWQAVWQIYLPTSLTRYYEDRPNAVHQGDLSYRPQTLTTVDAASRFKVAEPLIDENAASVEAGLEHRLSNHFGFCLCVCVSTDRLSNDYIRNSLPIFTKFCMQLRNVVVSNAIVSETYRKQITDFRDVQNPILAVSRLWWTYFPMVRHKNPDFREVQMSVSASISSGL